MKLNCLVLPNGYMVREIDKIGCKYLGIMEIDK